MRWRSRRVRRSVSRIWLWGVILSASFKGGPSQPRPSILVLCLLAAGSGRNGPAGLCWPVESPPATAAPVAAPECNRRPCTGALPLSLPPPPPLPPAPALLTFSRRSLRLRVCMPTGLDTHPVTTSNSSYTPYLLISLHSTARHGEVQKCKEMMCTDQHSTAQHVRSDQGQGLQQPVLWSSPQRTCSRPYLPFAITACVTPSQSKLQPKSLLLVACTLTPSHPHCLTASQSPT